MTILPIHLTHLHPRRPPIATAMIAATTAPMMIPDQGDPAIIVARQPLKHHDNTRPTVLTVIVVSNRKPTEKNRRHTMLDELVLVLVRIILVPTSITVVEVR